MTPRLVPILAAIGMVVAFLGGYALRNVTAERDLAECQRVHAEALAITLRAAQQAEADYRAREAQITKEHADALAVAHDSTAQARADADRVRAALERLRRAAASAAGSGEAAPGAAAAGASAPTGAAADLPPDLLWRVGQAAGELAAAADDARIAGRACQQAYDALRDAQPPRLGAAPIPPKQIDPEASIAVGGKIDHQGALHASGAPPAQPAPL